MGIEKRCALEAVFPFSSFVIIVCPIPKDSNTRVCFFAKPDSRLRALTLPGGLPNWNFVLWHTAGLRNQQRIGIRSGRFRKGPFRKETWSFGSAAFRIASFAEGFFARISAQGRLKHYGSLETTKPMKTKPSSLSSGRWKQMDPGFGIPRQRR